MKVQKKLKLQGKLMMIMNKKLIILKKKKLKL